MLSTHECRKSPLLPAPIQLQDRSWEVPAHSQGPTWAACQGLRAWEEAMPRGKCSAATSSSQPVQVIVIIVTEERRGRGTPLHALQATPEGNWSTSAAPRYFITTEQTALKSLPALRNWEQEASLPKFLFLMWRFAVEIRFRLDSRKNFLMERNVKHWHRLLRAVWNHHPWSVQKVDGCGT